MFKWSFLPSYTSLHGSGWQLRNQILQLEFHLQITLSLLENCTVIGEIKSNNKGGKNYQSSNVLWYLVGVVTGPKHDLAVFPREYLTSGLTLIILV